jgi:hypothetical protein
MLRVRRDTLARALRTHGEDDLAGRVLSLTDEELKRVGERADHYAFSGEHAVASGPAWGPQEHSPWRRSMCWRALRANCTGRKLKGTIPTAEGVPK